MTTRHLTYMPLASLVPAVRNPKDHSLPDLIASLTRYGWVDPVLVDERTGRMVGGHGRREAAIMMLQAGDPPPGGVFVDDDGDWLVPVFRGWESRDDTEAEALIIALNQIPAAGGWIDRTLAEMLEDVITTDAPLMETLGFTADDIDALIARQNPEWLDSHEQDDPPPPEAKTPDIELEDDTPVPDPDLQPRTRVHTCPECSYEWSD